MAPAVSLLGPSHSRMMLVAFVRVSGSPMAGLAASGGNCAEPVFGAKLSGVLLHMLCEREHGENAAKLQAALGTASLTVRVRTGNP